MSTDLNSISPTKSTALISILPRPSSINLVAITKATSKTKDMDRTEGTAKIKAMVRVKDTETTLATRNIYLVHVTDGERWDTYRGIVPRVKIAK
jgi:hypothetical protein